MSDSALDQSRTCLHRLLDLRQPITFTAVAEQARIGRATLYRNQHLRAIVDEHRTRQTDARTLTGLATEIAHLRTALEALAATRQTPRRTTPQTRTTPHHRHRLNTPNSRATHQQKLAGQSYDKGLAS